MSRRGSFRGLGIAILMVLFVLVAGTAGYVLIEGFPFVDALYTTVTMMTTVGHIIRPLDEAGRWFTIVVTITGLAALLYTFGLFMEYVLEGHLGLAIRRRLMLNKIASLRNHAVICGFGRVGLQIAEELLAAGTPFVVIDDRDTSAERSRQKGYLTLEGDATSDDVLVAAGIQYARSLLVATDNDATNISIALSARHLSDKLQIIARANHSETEVKLQLAGANRVLSPYTLGGHRMANMALKPELPTLPGD